jgi:penicillin-binding protein 1A
LAEFPFPAAGKTGTQVDNTNSWFVGYTPQLATAVWVGDPDGYTPMIRENVPEFYDLDGVDAVQGGTYPARIWGAYQQPAIADLAVEDWYPPPASVRRAARLFLPGEECVFEIVRGEFIIPGASTTTTTSTIAPPAPTLDPNDPDATLPPEPGPTTPTTVQPVVLQLLPAATTIPPEILDPRAPLPSVPVKQPVVACREIPPTVTLLPPKKQR